MLRVVPYTRGRRAVPAARRTPSWKGQDLEDGWQCSAVQRKAREKRERRRTSGKKEGGEEEEEDEEGGW